MESQGSGSKDPWHGRDSEAQPVTKADGEKQPDEEEEAATVFVRSFRR